MPSSGDTSRYRFIVIMLTVLAVALPPLSCGRPALDPRADHVFRLDAEKNIFSTSYRSGDATAPAFQLLIRAVKNISAPDRFEILSVVPVASQEIILITRQHGVLSTADWGEHWKRLDSGLPPEVVYPFEDHGLTKPVIGASVSRDRRRIALLFPETLFLSLDGGRTFRPADLEGAASNVEYLCVAWHSDRANLILLGTAQLGTKAENGVYVSQDGGRTITGIEKGLPGEPPQYPNYFEEVRALCFGGDPDTFFAGLGNGGGVFKGSIKAATFEKLAVPELYTYPDGDFYRVESLVWRNNALYVATNRPWKKVIPLGNGDQAPAADRPFRELFLTADRLVSLHAAGGDNASFAPAYQPPRSFSPDPRVFGKKAMYISYTFTQGDNYPKLVAMLKFLRLNAVVINVKDDYGSLRVETDDPLLLTMKDAVSPYVDMAGTIARLKSDGIYVIGRMVVFKDEYLFNAENHKYAIKLTDGRPLPKGPEKWVDPYSEFVWDYNIAAARAVAAAGVDEIQFDYIRLPDLRGDNLQNARYDFKRPNQTAREALVSFLKKARQVLTVPISIDLFGFQAVYKFGRWIGQDITEMSAWVDAVSPMFYPSHYSGGYAEGYGDRRIYYTIYLSCKRALELMGDAHLRPYIQAFYYKDNSDNYGVDYIGWELDGIKDAGGSDFIFWNDLSEYVILMKGMQKYLGDDGTPLTAPGIQAMIPRKRPFSSILVNP